MPHLSWNQVNPAQTERLYAQALAYAGLTGRETVVDAYCGIGTIGLCAAAAGAAQVYGVEQTPAAVQDARANAAHNGIKNARFACADATPWMRRAAAEGLRAVLERLRAQAEGLELKERAALAARLLTEAAQARGLSLKLVKKP